MGYEIDFLPVGKESRSGDAILLRYGNLHGGRDGQTVVLIDGGFRETADSILTHLDKYYGTETIDLVISTHPDADHINGLRELFDRIGNEHIVVRELWMHRPSRWRATILNGLRNAAETEYAAASERALDAAADLENAALRFNVPVREPFAGLTHSSGNLSIVGPTEQFYRSLFEDEAATIPSESRLLQWLRGGSEFLRSIAEDWNIETLGNDGVTSPFNNSSAIVRLDWKERLNLLTGDAGIPALEMALDYLEADGFDPSQLGFVQVPHHGSQRNVGPAVLDRLLGPRRSTDESTRSAFASVAKKGAPKHPAKKVANAFRRRGTPVHVTEGHTKHHHRDAPSRGWPRSEPLPFFETVEE